MSEGARSGQTPGAHDVDVAIIGGGQSALAAAYYLRRSSLSYILLDAEPEPGGSWQHAWPSLRLFSPGQWSSLPGYLMPRGAGEYPTRDETVAYLAEYERRYAIAIERPVRVGAVTRDGDTLRLTTNSGEWTARAVISATGSWANPFVPAIDGADAFRGRRIHSAFYEGPGTFAGQRVIVVGGGNSGAQIVADLAATCDVTWATLVPPTFLPDEIDGRYLFEQATRRYKALQEGRTPDPPRSLGDIVAVPAVREARGRGQLVSRRMFVRFTESGVVWPDGTSSDADAVIWATGFRPALDHLAPLGVVGSDGRVAVRGTRSVVEPRLWLLGYGEWTGYASATLIGVGRSARGTVDEVVRALAVEASPGGETAR